MANHQVDSTSLTPGKYIFLKGRVMYSRIASQFTQEEVRKRDEQARQRNPRSKDVGKPHTTISIGNVEVLAESGDANNLTTEEFFVRERCYTSKAKDFEGSLAYSINDKSPNLPPVLERNDDGSYQQLKLEGELDKGLEVILVIETYEPKSNPGTRGTAISQILLQEPVRYYSNAGSVDPTVLEARGIVIKGPIQQIKASEADPQVSQASVQQDGMSFPAPVSEQPQPQFQNQAPQVQPQVPQQQQQAPQQVQQPQFQNQAPQPNQAPQQTNQGFGTNQPFQNRQPVQVPQQQQANPGDGSGNSAFDAPAQQQQNNQNQGQNNQPDPWGNTTGITFNGQN